MGQRYILLRLLLLPTVIIAQLTINDMRVMPHAYNDKPSLEYARIHLYCTQDPRIVVLNKTKTVLELFIPEAQMSNAVLNELQRVNKKVGDAAKIDVTQVKNPVTGIKIILSYNPDAIVCEHELYYDMQGKPICALILRDAHVLKHLTDFHKPVLSTASHTPAVLIDCGHGGEDVGATSILGYYEKDITLALGRRLKQTLEEHNITCYMVRDRDMTCTLEDRVCAVNALPVDLLISLHANSAENNSARGYELYVRGQPKNHVFHHSSPAQHAAINIVYNKLIATSTAAAQSIAHALEPINTRWHIPFRGIKHHALRMTHVPSIPALLIEVGFVSSPQEAQILLSELYQSQLISGLTSGILSFFKQSCSLLQPA